MHNSDDETEHAGKPPRWRRLLVPLLGFCLFSAIAVIADKVFDAWLPEEAIVEYLEDFRDELAVGLEQFSPADIWLTFQEVARPPVKACQESEPPSVLPNSTITKSCLVEADPSPAGLQGVVLTIFTFDAFARRP